MGTRMRLYKAKVEIEFYFYDEGVYETGEEKPYHEIEDTAWSFIDEAASEASCEDIRCVDRVIHISQIPERDYSIIPYGEEYFNDEGEQSTIGMFIEEMLPLEQFIDPMQISLEGLS